jgi:hypothetical protein
MSNANLIRSDVMPVLNILEILTTLEEYTIAIGGVVEGIALVTIIVRHRFKGSIRIAKHRIACRRLGLHHYVPAKKVIMGSTNKMDADEILGVIS